MNEDGKNLKQQPKNISISIKQLNKNQISIKDLMEVQKWSVIKKIRADILMYSLKKSMMRVQRQKQFSDLHDEIQIQQMFNEKVQNNVNYTQYNSQYADNSTVNKGRFSNDGKYFGTVGSTGEGRIWNTCQQTFYQPSFCSEISLLLANVKMCDIAFNPKIGKIPQFAPNIVTSSSNGQLFFWTFANNLKQQKSFKLTPHKDRINSIQFHQSGNYLLSSSYDMSWSLWDSSRLTQIYNQKGHQSEIHCSTLHPDGSLYFTGDLSGSGMLWDLRSGKGVYQIKESNSILCCDINSTGYQLAVGGKNNMISIKDLRRTKSIKQIPAHTKLISGLKYHQNDSILTSVSHDNELKLWHGRNYTSVNLQNLSHTSKITSVDIKNGMIATTTIDRRWILWILKGYQNNKVKLENIEQEKEQEQKERENQAE